ncbi:MAG: precorrin-3B C(17)-methyltransferase [Magnetovibrio sp.]|nr:precorrin-3B C(17)-methyltransferase [Magnetovibrio sp.]
MSDPEIPAGKLIGVSVGPGALDLMTVRAAEVVKSAPVIAYMHATDKDPLALEIVRPLLPNTVEYISVPVPMGADRTERRKCYKKAIPEFLAHLERGQDIAFICEGDALFYGSFQYVMDELISDYVVEIIPGVTSIQACSSSAGMGLTRDNDTLQVLPATLPEHVLNAKARDKSSALTIMKIGRHLDKVKRVLAHAGRLDDARWVERASQDGEKVSPLALAPNEASYFSLVLCPAAVPQAPQNLPEGAVVVCLNEAGLAVARQIKAALPDAVLWVRKGRVQGSDFNAYFEDTGVSLRGLYLSQRPIVAVMSAGIVARILAPLLEDKRAEPPVVAVSPDGGFAVPLLGGHNGANRLAEAISAETQGFAAITTAGDAALGVALDDPPPGWSIANPERAKDIATKLLNGEDVGLQVDSGDASWLEPAGFTPGAEIGVYVTHKRVQSDTALILHPPTLAVGVGCERHCMSEELSDLVVNSLDKAGLAPESVACIASIKVKSDEKTILDLSLSMGVEPRFFSALELEEYFGDLKNPSEVVFQEVGCHGVAEGAALAASKGKLTLEKAKSKRATCAVAVSDHDIDPKSIGRGPGRLYVVGIGPGTDAWRTPQVTKLISEVSDVVGYGFYLDLIPDLIEGKIRHTSILSEEEARVRQALELAAEGKDVALISSGDIGIYAMASLVFELLDREDRDDWNRLYIQVEPGISAFQAAAARIGAPVGHDFCLISLSDLLTPWEVIQRRLKAAAEGGFVVSFYNPVSKRRRTQLAEARDILLQHRDPDTPVVLARQLGRPDEKIDVITLAELTPDHADMLTLVMVGGEDTRVIERGENRWVYTPRGYGGKMDATKGA